MVVLCWNAKLDDARKNGQSPVTVVVNNRKNIEAIGKPSASTLIVHNYLQKHPITNAKKTVELCKITLPTANKSLHHLADLGIVKEMTRKVRNKVYVYQKYLDILSEGAGPINES